MNLDSYYTYKHYLDEQEQRQRTKDYAEAMEKLKNAQMTRDELLKCDLIYLDKLLPSFPPKLTLLKGGKK